MSVPLAWRGVTQRRGDDCLVAALATMLGCDVDKLPCVDHRDPEWLTSYNLSLAAAGIPLALITMDVPSEGTIGRWIAVVPSLTQTGTHAVVMSGPVLLWDPGRRERYSAINLTLVKCAIVPVLTGSIEMLRARVGR